MHFKYDLIFLLFCSHFWLSINTSAQPSNKTFGISSNEITISANLIKEISDTINVLMKKHDIPGLSIGIVNKDTILLTKAFGVKKKNNVDSINVETIFSLQSVSKAITATAVMIAVQESLVSLDTPIVSYLNKCTVNSKFEKDPEKKITLRHLLSHRAGFTHEAPIGNNYQTEFESFEKHIKSISDTWLKSEVGKLYSYSNLGIDLSGYIIQLKSGMKFEDYVKMKVLNPLNMKYSSFDWKQIKKEANRALGNDKDFENIPVEFAMIPAGACYSNVIDMSRFIQFHLNQGKHNGKSILNKQYFDEMYEIPFNNSDIGYALCIDITTKNGEYVYSHSGGGFGFQTLIKWTPKLNIGIVVLTNSTDHNNIHKLIADMIIDKLRSPSEIKLANIPQNKWKGKTPITLSKAKYTQYSGPYVITEGNQEFELLLKGSEFGAQGENVFIPFNFVNYDGDLFVQGFGPELDGEYKIVLNEITCRPLYLVNKIDRPILYYNGQVDSIDEEQKSNYDKIVGSYSRKMYDSLTTKHKITIKNDNLYFDMFRLEEYIPNLFYASNGEVLDFRNEIPTYRNILLFKER